MDDNGIPDGWHRFPKDDAWKKCTLRGLVENGERLWLYCAGCRRTRYLETVQWAETHGVNLDWPLLTLARRMRCSRCNRKAVSLRASLTVSEAEVGFLSLEKAWNLVGWIGDRFKKTRRATAWC